MVAFIDTELKSGTTVEYAYHTCKDALNANREFSFVSARTGKISNAKKHSKNHMAYRTAL